MFLFGKLAGQPGGSEDCLFLNVFLPEGTLTSSDPKAVMVWIHGGAFIEGSSSKYDAVQILKEDIILGKKSIKMALHISFIIIFTF